MDRFLVASIKKNVWLSLISLPVVISKFLMALSLIAICTAPFYLIAYIIASVQGESLELGWVLALQIVVGSAGYIILYAWLENNWEWFRDSQEDEFQQKRCNLAILLIITALASMLTYVFLDSHISGGL